MRRMGNSLMMSRRAERSSTCSATLLFWGLESFFKLPEADPRLKAIRNCRLVKVPNAGHWVHHDQLALFLKETKLFLGN